jgi:hypothetical protein
LKLLLIDTDIDNIERYPPEEMCTINIISEKNLLQKEKQTCQKLKEVMQRGHLFTEECIYYCTDWAHLLRNPDHPDGIRAAAHDIDILLRYRCHVPEF